MTTTTATTLVPVDELLADFEQRHVDENALAALRTQLDLRADRQAELLREAQADGAEELRASEQRRFTRLQDERRQIGELLDRAEREVARRNAGNRFGRIRVGHEASVYRPDERRSYFADLWRATREGDIDAQQRLHRHAQEIAGERPELLGLEQRDLTRTDGSGGQFVPPAYLVDEFVELARAGRPTANVVRRLALPGGTDSINIPKVSTGTSTATQAADNAAVSETDLSDENLAAPVRTIAGQQDVSVQLLEQSPVGFDRVVFADLLADHNTRLDVQVLSGSGASGQVLGIRNVTGVGTVTYTDTTPTVPEAWAKLADAIQQVHANRFLPPTHIVMHPRRWGWFLASLDTSNRPLFVPSDGSASNAMGSAGGGSQGVVGRIQGLDVVVDASLPVNLGAGSNEDTLIVLRADDVWLWESPVRTRILPDVGSGTLTTRLQLYSFVALQAARYPRSITLLTGNGWVTPTF